MELLTMHNSIDNHCIIGGGMKQKNPFCDTFRQKQACCITGLLLEVWNARSSFTYTIKAL